MKRYFSVVLVSLALFAGGCSRLGIGEHTDAQVTADVQSKITGDSNVPDKQLSVTATNGVVTLSGSVSSDGARLAAANDAAQVAGVRTVVNNLTVAPTMAANNVPPPAQTQPQEMPNNYPSPAPAPCEVRRPSPRKYSDRPRARDIARNDTPANSGDDGSSTPEPEPIHHDSDPHQEPQQTSPPPPPPPPQRITVPSGTPISISLSQELSSEVAQVGDIFHGSISSPVVVDGQTVIPTSADVEGRVVEVKPAARFAGQSDLVLELTRLLMNGQSYSLQTDRGSKQGNARGKATAAKIGGGAAVGAILGGIFGGGKGAAIGAAAGAGAGTGVAGANKGQQVILKPETVLPFQLQSSVTVTPGASTSRRPLDQRQ
jgi:hypothetical protein